MKMLTIAAAAIAVLASTSTLANTQDDVANTSAQVYVGDLNLNTAEGQDTLNRRINTAIRQVCATPNYRVLDDVANYRACVAGARGTADVQVAQLLQQRRYAVAGGSINGTITYLQIN